MEANLLDINGNLEKVNLEANCSSINGSEEINLESTDSDGFENDTADNIQQTNPVNESILAEPNDRTNGHTKEDVTKTKFFAIRITGGQERVVANILYTKITTKKL